MRKLIVTLFLACSSCMGAINYLPSLDEGSFQLWQGGYYVWASAVAAGWTDTNSPIAIYYMQDTNGAPTIVDSSGNGLDGTPEPSVATGPTYTNLGARADGQGDEIARRLDDIDDYIDLGDRDAFSFGNGSTDSPFTFMDWVYVDSLSAVNYILNKDNGTSAREWQFKISTAGKLQIVLLDGNAFRFATSDAAISAGSWAHVAGTYDGSGGSGAANGLTFYINGIVSTDTTGSSGTYVAMSNTAEPVYIGRRLTAYYDGEVDDTRIYDKEVSSNFVYEVYSNTTHPTNSIENRLTP